MFSTMIIMTNLEELLPEVGVEPPVEDGVAHHHHHHHHHHHLANLEELLPEVGVEPPVEDGVADTGGERDTVTNAQDEVVHLNRHLVTHHSFIMLVIVIIGFGIR